MYSIVLMILTPLQYHCQSNGQFACDFTIHVIHSYHNLDSIIIIFNIHTSPVSQPIIQTISIYIAFYRDRCKYSIVIILIPLQYHIQSYGQFACGFTYIHAKSGRYLRYISAIFFGFSAKF